MAKVGKNYTKINGCSRQLECQQVFWVFYVALLVTLYSVFVAPPIVQWEDITMIVFMAILYFLFLPIIVDYIVLTCTDPVDPHILQETHEIDAKLKKCSICNVAVGLETQHCLNCQRCTDRLDHHSQLINNCISLNNFSNYLRLNLCFSLVLGIMMAQSIAVFVLSHSEPELQSYIINKWAIMMLVILTFISFLFSIINSLFTCYLHFGKNMTRIQYRFRQTDSNNSDFSDSAPNEGNQETSSEFNT